MQGLRLVSTIWVRTLWLLLAIAGVVFAPLASAYGMRWGLAGVIVCLLLMLLRMCCKRLQRMRMYIGSDQARCA